MRILRVFSLVVLLLCLLTLPVSALSPVLTLSAEQTEPQIGDPLSLTLTLSADCAFALHTLQVELLWDETLLGVLPDTLFAAKGFDITLSPAGDTENASDCRLIVTGMAADPDGIAVEGDTVIASWQIETLVTGSVTLFPQNVLLCPVGFAKPLIPETPALTLSVQPARPLTPPQPEDTEVPAACATEPEPDGMRTPEIVWPTAPTAPDFPQPVWPTLPQPTLPFADVPADAPCFDALWRLWWCGLVDGTSDTTFSPDLPVSRAAWVAQLHRLAGQPPALTSPAFFDVPEDAWYAPAVAWASELGVALGVGEGRFAPEETVTREQALAILYRLAGTGVPLWPYEEVMRTLAEFGLLEGRDILPPLPEGVEAPELSRFADGAAVSLWAEEPMLWALRMGLVSAPADGLAPSAPLLRAEAVVLLHDFWRLFG